MLARSARDGGKAGHSISERAAATSVARRRSAASASAAARAARRASVFAMHDGGGGADDGSAEARAAAPMALPGTPERRGTRKRRGSARFLSDSDVDEDAEAYMSVGSEEEPEDEEARESSSDSGAEEAAAQPEQHGAAGGGGMPDLPPRGRRLPGVRRIKPPCTDLHVLAPQRKCSYGCGALVWVEEGSVCCSAGKHILGPEYNPPIDDGYWQILKLEHISKDSRHLNAALAMGTQGVFPPKAMGGLAWHEQGNKWAFLSLLGTAYLRMLPLGSNNAFDSHMLPDNLLVDGAAMDLGRDYAERLLRTRAYLRENHPLASCLYAIADVPAERVDLNPFMRLEAQSLRTSGLELAFVSSGVPRPEDHANKVLYFDMRLHDQGLAPVAVHRHNALYDLLMFPLLHEKGVGGYFLGKDGNGVRSATGVKLSLQMYTRAMLFQNERLHYLGRLAQEYALVQHSRNVENTLSFQRFGGLQAHMQRRRDKNPRVGQEGAGSRVALTASVVGSFKYNQALIDDSTAVANVYGNGSLFITVTCNPTWAEVKAAMLPGQEWEDRADVLNRLFRVKLQEVLADLRAGTFFKDKHGKPWKAKYTMYVIEFQKRGKPHAHIVIRFEGAEEDMPKTAAVVDTLINARLPVVDKNCACAPCSAGDKAACLQQRRLNAVRRHMIHKCAVGVCMSKEGPRVCRRGYPKAPCPETTYDDGGYPSYMRGVGDEFVVPHNLDMLLKYDCHINVELCSTVWVHKYMHKYMHKGPDSVRMITKDLYQNLKNSGMNMEDEVLKFQTFRYLSAGEAICRINGYNLSQSSVGCTRLSVHLEGMDWVGDNVALPDGSSTLLDYFSRPPALSPLLYLQYFSKHTVQKASAAERAAAAGGQPFKPKRGNAYYLDSGGKKVVMRNPGSLHVARMYPVAVSQGEQYYLRSLLACVPATSFVDLRTVGDTVYATYREAAEARGLLSVEREFAEALGLMASGLGTGLATIGDLRNTFVMMAVAGGEGVPVLELYREFRYMMALDIDVSGAISPPGMDKGVVYARLPVVEYVEGEHHSLDHYPVHEYHLLRLLEDLLQRNYSRSLEDLGLPTLRALAAAHREGGAVPYLRLVLEGYLHVAPGAEEAFQAAHGAGAAVPGLGAPAAPNRALAQLHLLRATYVNNYPELLTGAHLARLLLEAEHLGQIGHEAAFFRDIDVGAEEATFTAMYETLNPEQRAFVDKACRGLQHQVARREALKNRTPVPDIPDDERYFHLQARGGRGKSYVTKCIIAKALHLRIIPCVSSFAGIAAILLPMGQTCHRTYGLPLDTSGPAPSSLTTRSAQGLRLAEAGLHVIDEADCLHRHLFESASSVTSRCVKDRYGVDTAKPFGDAMVLFLADKHQSLPITKGLANDDVIIYSMLRSSPLFAYFTTSELTIAQRSKDDAAYDAWLGRLSVNRAPGPVEVADDEQPPTMRRVYIPEQCFKTTSLDDALVWLFGPAPPPEGPFPELNPRYALLATLNKTVDAVNDIVLDRYVGGAVITLEAAHEASKDSAGNDAQDGISRTHATIEYMRGVTQSGVPSATLRLKKGCIMILTRNMLSTLGLVNGTRLRLLSDAPPDGASLPVLHVETVGMGEPRQFFLPRIIFELTTPGGLKFVRRQFPVRLAYAFTGNKAQGQTILKAVYDSRHESFSHGTAYVANSRTTTFATLGFLHAPLPEEDPGGRPTFVNYVLQRALAAGVLEGAARPQAHMRGAMDLHGEEGEDGSEEEEVLEEEEEAPAAPGAALPQRAPAPATRPARFQKTALTLTQRRIATHESVKHYYGQ